MSNEATLRTTKTTTKKTLGWQQHTRNTGIKELTMPIPVDREPAYSHLEGLKEESQSGSVSLATNIINPPSQHRLSTKKTQMCSTSQVRYECCCFSKSEIYCGTDRRISFI